jgi:Tfp pilus assembly protein PilX
MQEYQRGQILLIVVLVMVTALTIGLSVAARTITNTRTSQEAENSEKAFSAAEAGIEQSLTNSNNVTGSFTNNTSYKTTVTTISGTQISLNNGSAVLTDDSQDLWLSTYPGYTSPWSGNITFYWGQPTDTCSNAEAAGTLSAVEIIVLSGTKANPQVTRYAEDPCSQRSLSNKFEYITSGGGTVDGKTYSYKKTIAVTSGLLVRVIPLYGSTAMGVTGCDGANANCSALPSQGTLITSIGTADTTQRKLVSYRRYPKLPIEIFPYSFFAPK